MLVDILLSCQNTVPAWAYLTLVVAVAEALHNFCAHIITHSILLPIFSLPPTDFTAALSLFTSATQVYTAPLPRFTVATASITYADLEHGTPGFAAAAGQ